MTEREGRGPRRGQRRLLVVAALAAAAAAVRKQKLDAADAAFPEASSRG